MCVNLASFFLFNQWQLDLVPVSVHESVPGGVCMLPPSQMRPGRMKPPACGKSLTGCWRVQNLQVSCFSSSWGSDICLLFVKLLVGHSVLNSELILSPSSIPPPFFFCFWTWKLKFIPVLRWRWRPHSFPLPQFFHLIPNLGWQSSQPGPFGLSCFIVCRAWRVQTDLSPPGLGKASVHGIV